MVFSGSYNAPPALAVPIPAGSSPCATGHRCVHMRIRQIQHSQWCEVCPPLSRAGLGSIWVLSRQRVLLQSPVRAGHVTSCFGFQ